MDFRIADTSSNSLAKLTGEEQKAINTTAFDLQLNPANPGMRFCNLGRAAGFRSDAVKLANSRA